MSKYDNPWHKVRKIRKKIGSKFFRQKKKLKEKNQTYREKVKKLFKKEN